MFPFACNKNLSVTVDTKMGTAGKVSKGLTLSVICRLNFKILAILAGEREYSKQLAEGDRMLLNQSLSIIVENADEHAADNVRAQLADRPSTRLGI